MFRFESSYYLLGLWIIPILIVLYFLYWKYRTKQLESLGQSRLINRLLSGYAPQRNHIRTGLLISAVLSMILALANPQWGNKKEKVEAKSSDVFIALDISQSMMAEDISPNRLERAKRLTQNVIQALRGNRIGLIYFAGSAYLQMPLTQDYSAAQMFVASANTGQAATQGTAISEAINLAQRAYQDDKPNQRALIVITDGESHDDEAIQTARDAHATGLQVFTIGVGTSEGAFVPYKTQNGKQYKRDASGNPVKSALNQQLISDMASSSGGKSYLIGEGNSIIADIKNAIDRLEKQDVEQKAFTDYASYFQYLIGIAALLILIEFVIPEGKEILKPASTPST